MKIREHLNVVLAALIAALGFGGCHHTKKMEVVTPSEPERDIPNREIMLMYGIPYPEAGLDTIMIEPEEPDTPEIRKENVKPSGPASRPEIMVKYGVMPPR